MKYNENTALTQYAYETVKEFKDERVKLEMSLYELIYGNKWLEEYVAHDTRFNVHPNTEC